MIFEAFFWSFSRYEPAFFQMTFLAGQAQFRSIKVGLVSSKITWQASRIIAQSEPRIWHLWGCLIHWLKASLGSFYGYEIMLMSPASQRRRTYSHGLWLWFGRGGLLCQRGGAKRMLVGIVFGPIFSSVFGASFWVVLVCMVGLFWCSLKYRKQYLIVLRRCMCLQRLSR